MRIYHHKSKHLAVRRQRSMHRLYGYRPAIIKVRSPKLRRISYVVVRPSGLRRIK